MNKTGTALIFEGNAFFNIQVHDNDLRIEKPVVYVATVPGNITIANSTFNCNSNSFINAAKIEAALSNR